MPEPRPPSTPQGALRDLYPSGRDSGPFSVAIAFAEPVFASAQRASLPGARLLAFRPAGAMRNRRERVAVLWPQRGMVSRASNALAERFNATNARDAAT